MSEELPETHKQQIEAGRRDSLNRAGIGAKYHPKSLADIPAGEEVAAFMRDAGVDALRSGKLVFVETHTAHGYDTVMLMARAMHLNGFGCRVTDVAKLCRMVELRDYASMDELVSTKVLVIMNFFDAADSEPCPFPGYLRRQIESILLDRVAEGKPSVLHVVRAEMLKALTDRDKQERLGWWSAEIQQLANSDDHAAVLRLTK